jgi:GH35 family endo-1,4-beta-xylanase
MAVTTNRREVLAGLAGAALTAGLPGSATPALSAAAANLGQIAKASNILFGAALGSAYYTDPAYKALFDQTTLLVSEWQFNLASLMPNANGVYDYWNADRIVQTAQAAAKPLKAHVLFWQTANPAWLSALSTGELQYLFDKHIDTVIPRYAGKIHGWNLINEPFWPADGNPGGFNNGPWYQAFGNQWPVRAFKRAAALDTTAKLCLNADQCDNNAAGMGATIRPQLLQLVDMIQQSGGRLDAVGLESHLDMDLTYDDALFGSFVGQLAQRNVEVWISELDVREFSLPADTAIRDALVAARIKSHLGNALKSGALTQVATWGLTDKYTWLASEWTKYYGTTVRQPRPLPYDPAYQPKPMWTALADAFQNRIVNTIPAKAAMTAPTADAVLTGTSQTFSWTPGNLVKQYWIEAGTTPGGTNIVSKSTGLAVDAVVGNLPVDGSKIYIRLWSLIGAAWQFTDYTFQAADGRAVILSPAAATTLTGASVTFNWNTGIGVSQYWLYAGTTPGGLDLYNQSTGTTRSAAIAGLPIDGGTVYVRLWSLISGRWLFTDTTYTSMDGRATLVSPAGSSTLAGPTAAFSWTTGSGVTQYWLELGRAAGGTELYSKTAGTALSVSVGGLPLKGETVYVRLWSLIAGKWLYKDYTVKAADGAAILAAMTSPAPGSVLTVPQAVFQWSAGGGATEYWLYAGSRPGGYDLYNKSTGLATSAPVGGLARAGKPVYVRLWSLVAGTWYFNDYTYAA